MIIYFFFFNDTATTEIYTLSLHDALPISCNAGIPTNELPNFEICRASFAGSAPCDREGGKYSSPGSTARNSDIAVDRKSTRLNSSHSQISYAVFCLKKKRYIGGIDVDLLH